MTKKMDGSEFLLDVPESLLDKRWSNYDNEKFYEELKVKEFQDFAAFAGLDTCCDLELITPHLKKDAAILEVGAGYGRALEYLLQNGYTNLYAIERDKKLCKVLQEKFGDRVTIFNTDLHAFKTEQKFDAILWLWAGVMDFSKGEQLGILKMLMLSLNAKGKLFIDTMLPFQKPANCIFSDGQQHVMKIDGKSILFYCPSYQEIEDYAHILGVKYKKNIYEVTTSKQRIMYLHELE